MKYIICLALLFVASISYAQIKLEGVVKDSLDRPFELANVIAINQETGGLETYGLTNEQGKYKLELGKNSTYNIQISYIGMKTFEEILSTKESDLTKDFTLRAINALDEVEVIYEMPVTVKGDTLVYNADSDQNGTERKLEDVLEIGITIA